MKFDERYAELRKNVDKEYPIIKSILEEIEDKEEYYKQIAYESDYGDDVVKKFVDLGIAYRDVRMYISLLLSNLEKYSKQLQRATVGDPTKVGQPLNSETEKGVLQSNNTDTQ